MAHIVELDKYFQLNALSLASTKSLLAGDFSISTTGRIQKELNAYCILNPKTFAGIVYHADGSGPEQPYDNPKRGDWKPEIQAIGRIGVQHEYWRLLHEALAAGNIDVSELISTEILILYPTGDGRVQVKTNSYPDFLNYVAKRAGDTQPKYPKYVTLINFGGDADFYGIEKKHIFPMEQRTLTGDHTHVARSRLGVPESLIENTWHSWRKINEAWGNIFDRAVRNSYVKLPNPLFELINRKIQRGEKITAWHHIIVPILQNGGTGEDCDVIQNEISSAMRVEARNPQLLQATADHANNLEQMYQTAKHHCRDIYHY